MTSIETTPMSSRVVAVRLRALDLVSTLLAAASALRGRIDRVVLAFTLFIVFIAAIDPALAPRTLAYVAAELGGLAPWFALSVLFAAGAKATGGDALVARAFVGREAWVIPIAAIVGGLTPFCSCGVIPLVAGLFGAGVPLAPVMAFWIASPLMDPTQFFVIAGTLGLGFAIAKTIAAVGMGLFGGYATMALTRGGLLPIDGALRVSDQTKSCCPSSRGKVATPVVWRFWQVGERAQVFLTSAAATGWFLVRWLALAFAIESAMTAWLPPAVIAHWLGSGPFAIPLAVLVGVPVYINGLAAVPFVAGMIQLGMSPAAALAFMLATTATGFAAMTAVSALVKPKVFALYIAFAIVGALLAGYAYQLALAVL
jgi:uncharacterized membrane protein YraQ (UPF0718 family)